MDIIKKLFKIKNDWAFTIFIGTCIILQLILFILLVKYFINIL